MAVEQIIEGDFSGVATAAAGVGSTVYDVLLWAVVGIMVVVLIGLVFFLLQFKHKVRIRYVTKDGSYIIDDKARRKVDGGVTYWSLLKSKISVTPPPRTALNITKKGKLVAECYITEDNPEPVWIEDKADIESADFKPLTTQQRSLTVARIRKAESRKRLSLWDKISQIVMPATMVVMVALPFVFWGEITDSSNTAMEQSGQVAAQNAKIAEQNARILSVLAGKVEAGDLDITQNIPPDAAQDGGGYLMDALATIIGIGLASFLLFFFSSQLEDKHGLLKLLSLFFVLAFLILIPKTLIDNQESCEAVVNTTTVNGSVTTYTYSDYCVSDDNATDTTFYKAVLWFYRLFMAYVIIYLGWEALQALMNSYKNRGRRN